MGFTIFDIDFGKIRMASRGLKTFACIAMLTLLSSCIEPGQFGTRERYVVTSRNLNVRSDPSRIARVIGTLSQGDTITALASNQYWIMIRYNDQSGFIAGEYIRPLEPIETPWVFRLIEDNSNWKTAKFWLIATGIVLLWIAFEYSSVKTRNMLALKRGVPVKAMMVSPLIAFASGILLGVLYLFWKDQVIESLFHRFTILPQGLGMISWVIWLQAVAICSGLAVDLIGSIFKSGMLWGSVIFLVVAFNCMVIYISTVYLTISLFITAIVFLVLVFGVQYILAVSATSRSKSGLLQK